jgi:hypothetical protein
MDLPDCLQSVDLTFGVDALVLGPNGSRVAGLRISFSPPAYPRPCLNCCNFVWCRGTLKGV